MISPWRWLHRNDYLYFSRFSNESNSLVDYGIVYYSIYYLYIVIIIYIQRLNYPVSIFLSNYLGTDKDAWEVKNDVSNFHPTLSILVIVFILWNEQSLSCDAFLLLSDCFKRFEKTRFCDRRGKTERKSRKIVTLEKCQSSWFERAVERRDYAMRLREWKRFLRKEYANSNSSAIHYGHVIRKKTVVTDFTLAYTSFRKISSNGLSINRCRIWHDARHIIHVDALLEQTWRIFRS